MKPLIVWLLRLLLCVRVGGFQPHHKGIFNSHQWRVFSVVGGCVARRLRERVSSW